MARSEIFFFSFEDWILEEKIESFNYSCTKTCDLIFKLRNWLYLKPILLHFLLGLFWLIKLLIKLQSQTSHYFSQFLWNWRSFPNSRKCIYMVSSDYLLKQCELSNFFLVNLSFVIIYIITNHHAGNKNCSNRVFCRSCQFWSPSMYLKRCQIRFSVQKFEILSKMIWGRLIYMTSDALKFFLSGTPYAQLSIFCFEDTFHDGTIRNNKTRTPSTWCRIDLFYLLPLFYLLSCWIGCRNLN